MARVQNTLIGRASGSVGQVVFLTWKLINVTRSKPLSVSNPNTIPQQTQRSKFAQTVGLYKLLKPILTIGLINRNRRMTLFNAFQHENQQNAFENIGGGVVVFNPEQLKISKGLSSLLQTTQVTANNGSNQILWQSSLVNLSTVNSGNIFAGVYMNQDTGLIISRLNIGNANTSSHSFSLGVGNNLVSGQTIHFWQFNYNQLTGVVSDTFYATKIVA